MSENHKIVIAGGSGFLGTKLSEYLSKHGYQIIVLSRKQQNLTNAKLSLWDGQNIGDWQEELENAEALINLSGKSVNCRFTEKNKKLLLSSRIDSTRVLGQAILKCKTPPKVWINASTATIYEHTYGRPHTEVDNRCYPCPDVKDEFSFEITQKWEEEFNKYTHPNLRKIALRISLIFDNHPGTVYQILKKLTKLGLGGKNGHGEQYVSWMHIKDFVTAVHWMIENHSATGAYNMSAPNPLSNREMMQSLRAVLNVPFGLPAEKWMLEIGAFFMRTETELILKSRNVYPEKLIKEGYHFQFTDFKEMIRDLEGHGN